MKKRRLLGALTIFAAIPSLAFIIFFTTVYKAPITHWFVMEKMIIVISSTIGGLLLLIGNKWGYRLSAIGWLVILYASIMNMYTALLPGTNETMRFTMFVKDGLMITIGIPAVVILVRDIKARKNVLQIHSADRE